jgi:hypothetical protein
MDEISHTVILVVMLRAWRAWGLEWGVCVEGVVERLWAEKWVWGGGKE